MKSIFAFCVSTLLAANAWAGEFTITASDIVDGQRLKGEQVLDGFGCQGANTSPHIAWADAPQGTKSFAVTLYDPDAPTGSGWWHWVAFNIPAHVSELPAGAGVPGKGRMPEGAVQSRTDFGVPGFGGACPPEGHGPHRYSLKVRALDVEHLDLDDNASGAMVGFFLGAHTLATAEVTGIYER